MINRDSNYPNDALTPSEPKLVAVIDVGASSVRMQIAEIRADGAIRKIESFSQALSLGKDSFSKGLIEHNTIEDCVHLLSVYRAKLDEYGITDPEAIRVIATSGVNEASNSLAFKDRIFIATQFEIEDFDQSILHRVTYLGLLPFLRDEPQYFAKQSVVIEVGGGTTELLLLDKEDVSFAKTYRLGALRLRKQLEAYDAPLVKSRELMEAQIDRYLEQFLHSVGEVGPKYLVSMGSDVRFAVQAIKQKPVVDQIVKLSTKELSKFADEVLKQSSESLVTKYHMSLPDAQSLGPSLLTHVMFAKALDVEKIAVANVNLRDGLIKEMTDNHQWTDSIQRQIVRSAMLLGRKYSFNEAHATHVASVACLLFDQLEVLHQLPRRWRGLLEIGALLHGIGLYISSRSRHKHSMYLINNSEMFGIGQQELQMIAMIARYFRGAPPQPSHPPYARLSRSNRVAISKLAAILRIAKALDVTHRQPFSKFECKLAPGEVEMFVDQSIDLSLEKLELKQTGGLFTSIFGRTPRLKSTRDEL